MASTMGALFTECKICKKAIRKKNHFQKYCQECSSKKDLQRKVRPATDEAKKLKRRYSVMTEEEKAQRLAGSKNSQQRAEAEAVGNRINEAYKTTRIIGSPWATKPRHPKHGVWVTVPFSLDFSKNRIYSIAAKSGHVFLRQEAKRTRAEITHLIKEQLSGERFYKGKVWVDIFVQKPSYRSDAINVIDSVCDAIKVAIGVDDTWFCIGKLDWEIAKKEPKLFLHVWQDISEDHFICPSCGRVLPISTYSRGRKPCVDCLPPMHPERCSAIKNRKPTVPDEPKQHEPLSLKDIMNDVANLREGDPDENSV